MARETLKDSSNQQPQTAELLERIVQLEEQNRLLSGALTELLIENAE